MLQDVTQPRGGVLWIQRHIGSSCFEDRYHGRQKGDIAFSQQGDHAFWSDAVIVQVMGHLICLVVQLPVRDVCLFAASGDGFRSSIDLRLKECCKSLFLWIRY